MSGILNQTLTTTQFGILTTEELRNKLLLRNLPPPVTNSVDHSGFASSLQDIGTVITTPIWGTESENIPTHYDEDEQILPFGQVRRNEFNVNNNRFIPLNDEYETFQLNTPAEPYSDSSTKVRGPYPTYSNTDQFSLISSGIKPYVAFPFNVVDKLNSLTFQNESSLGIIGAEKLKDVVIAKVAQVQEQVISESLNNWVITPFDPPENEAGEYSNTMKGEDIVFNSLPFGAVGWQEYNRLSKSNKIGGSSDGNTEAILSTEQRVNTLLTRTGLNSSTFLFNALGLNLYVPNYEDRRLTSDSNDGTNSRYYIGSERSTNRGAKVTKLFTSDEFNGADGSSSPGESGGITSVNQEFYWSTDNNNFNDKTLLSATQDLVNENPDDVFIDQTKKYFKDKIKDQLISRGSAISKESYQSAIANGKFCRVWTVEDGYSYKNAIRKSGLFSSDDISKPGFSVTSDNAALSVLGQNGIVKTFPVADDSTTTYKKYMLSLENLAWADNLADLPMSETGPGDAMSNNKGRIMWFPPYDLNFDENISANWTKTDFIGRGEPVYTYNNSTRSGQLRFKVLVDHPKVINAYRGKRTNEIERFFAGCLSPQEFLDFLDKSDGVSENAKTQIEKKLNQQQQQQTSSNYTAKEKNQLFYTKNQSAGVNIDSSAITLFLSQQKATNKTVKVVINGYASSDEANPKDLASERAADVKTQVSVVLQTLKGIKFTIQTKATESKLANDPQSRRVDLIVSYDATKDQSAKHKSIEPPGDLAALPVDSQIFDNVRIDESKYFDYVNETYPNYFASISEKIKYFHPGFHSTTPEGLNTRVTFLQQCTRQGPSIYDKDDTIQPQNLAFGRPPVCILRIGDFIYTKIVINSLTINYNTGNAPQWDLNPEGIGVQPMMADVTMSIDIIGGQSLQGPINRLQNALSFNYYANTEMYERRSDRIEIDRFIGARIVDGKKAMFPQIQNALKKLSLIGDAPDGAIKQSVPLNQMDENIPDNPIDVAPPNETPPTLIINASNKNIYVESLVAGVPTVPDSNIEVIITDSIDDSQWIKEQFSESSEVFDISGINKFSIAFSNSEKIVTIESEITTLTDDYASETNPNIKYNILSEIVSKKAEIKALEDIIPNVVVTTYYIDNEKATRKIKTFTIRNNKLN